MSIKFYKTILSFVFCLSFISPIKLQAYCQFEGCGVSSNLDEAPLTLQEAQEIKEFYTSVERDLSENLEVLQDGTYQVRFSENVNVLLGMGMAVVSGDHGGPGGGGGKYTKEDAEFEGRIFRRKNEIWERHNNFLKNYFKDIPHVYITETPHDMLITVTDPRKKYRVTIERERIYGDPYSTHNGSRNTLYFGRKIDGKWQPANNFYYLKYIEKEYFDELIGALQSDDPTDFKKYLKAGKIRFTLSVIISKAVRASKFVGRWTFRAVLASASIVGGQMLFDYAQENHPHETGLVIAITKEQWENLVTNVRGIIEELSENNVLNELEL